MARTIWPLSQWRDDRISSGTGVLVFGPEADRFQGLAPSSSVNASLACTNSQECNLWQQLPFPVAILGAGSGAASTCALSLPINNGEGTCLSEVILGSIQIQFHTFEPPSKPHPRCPLGPGNPPRLPKWLARTMQAAADQLPGGSVEKTAVAAGLHLLYDDLDGSHALSQTVEGRGQHRNGDYWHAIMHRREPDYGNSPYWFRRVGSHPVMAELPTVLERVRQEIPSPTLDTWAPRLVKNGVWDAFAYVDACEAAAQNPSDHDFRRGLEELQHFEMLHLLVQSCRDAQR